MKIYLLIENETNKTVGLFKYSDVALLRKNRKGIWDSIKSEIVGDEQEKYRVEVMELVE